MAVGKGLRRGTSKRVLAGLAVLGVIAISGLVAGWGASPAETSVMLPSDVVALRFPPDWSDDDTTGSAPAATPASYALASATDTQQLETKLLFSPYQTVSTAPPPADAVAPDPAPPGLATDNASGPKVDAKPNTKVQTKSEAKLDSKPATKSDPKPAAITRALAAEPERRVRKDSGALFNDAQLASIKNRLKLSEYQEQYWPPVASALRDIGWRAAHGDTRKGNSRTGQAMAEIDPNSDEVQQLKSAAFPLIMSMNEDQKREVRMLAQVMGLERVAASF
ncbi:MAG TPA: hypothetical protein VGH49_02815 [Xanthobacteraceae bacterium]